jgi:hypothetical protein
LTRDPFGGAPRPSIKKEKRLFFLIDGFAFVAWMPGQARHDRQKESRPEAGFVERRTRSGEQTFNARSAVIPASSQDPCGGAPRPSIRKEKRLFFLIDGFCCRGVDAGSIPA